MGRTAVRNRTICPTIVGFKATHRACMLLLAKVGGISVFEGGFVQSSCWILDFASGVFSAHLARQIHVGLFKFFHLHFWECTCFIFHQWISFPKNTLFSVYFILLGQLWSAIVQWRSSQVYGLLSNIVYVLCLIQTLKRIAEHTHLLKEQYTAALAILHSSVKNYEPIHITSS